MFKSDNPAVIGLTGGIGSGKSTVAAIFSELGLPVLDLDRVAHQVTAPESEGLKAVVKQFGEGVLHGGSLNNGGVSRQGLNRDRLAAICFASDEKTQQLNQIVHPLIWQQAEQWRSQQEAPYVIIEASVLIESKGEVDCTVVVMAEIKRRKKRVLLRKNMSGERFDSIVSRQCSDRDRFTHADYIIQNDRSIVELNREVQALHKKLNTQFAG